MIAMFYRRSGAAEDVSCVSCRVPLCVGVRSQVVLFLHVVGIMGASGYVLGAGALGRVGG